MLIFDAGHGGIDPGAVGPGGTREADINNIMARKCQILAIGAGIGAGLTHTGMGMIPGADPNTELNARTRWIKAQVPAASVSIHCNAAADRAAHGCEVYFYPGDKRGERLANEVYKLLLPALNIAGRGVKYANFAMTREPSRLGIPAILIELAFISNPAEEQLLLMQSAQDQAAAAIVKGVLEYMGIENSVQPAADSWAIRVNEAVAWVQAKGISDGLRPYDTLTRGELFVILQNAVEKGII